MSLIVMIVIVTMSLVVMISVMLIVPVVMIMIAMMMTVTSIFGKRSRTGIMRDDHGCRFC
jgi:hypothetical protein